PRFSQSLGSMMSSARPGPAPAALHPHAEKWRPILPAGVGVEAAAAVMAERTVFAEETLQKFFELLRIHPGFAHASYEYLGQELQGHDYGGLPVSLHLGFERRPR